MTAQTEMSRTPVGHHPSAVTSPTRALGQLLWNAWPFADANYPFRDRRLTATPLRVEQFYDNDQLVIRAEAPGIEPLSDLGIIIDGGVLTITAVRRQVTASGPLQSELRYGKFLRQVRLPDELTTAAACAVYRAGIVEIRIGPTGSRRTGQRVEVNRE